MTATSQISADISPGTQRLLDAIAEYKESERMLDSQSTGGVFSRRPLTAAEAATISARFAALPAEIEAMLKHPQGIDLQYTTHQSGSLFERNLFDLLMDIKLNSALPVLMDAGFDWKQFPKQRFAHDVLKKLQDDAIPILKEMKARGYPIEEENTLGQNLMHLAAEENLTRLFPDLEEMGFDPYAISFLRFGKITAEHTLFKRLAKLVTQRRIHPDFDYVMRKGICKYTGTRVDRRVEFINFVDALGNNFEFARAVWPKADDLPALEFNYLDGVRMSIGRSLRDHLHNPDAQPDLPARITHNELLMCYSAGLGGVAFSPALWHQHPDLFMQHYQNMPEHIQAEMRTIAAPLFVVLCDRVAAQQPAVSWSEKLEQESSGQQQRARA